VERVRIPKPQIQHFQSDRQDESSKTLQAPGTAAVTAAQSRIIMSTISSTTCCRPSLPATPPHGSVTADTKVRQLWNRSRHTHQVPTKKVVGTSRITPQPSQEGNSGRLHPPVDSNYKKVKIANRARRCDRKSIRKSLRRARNWAQFKIHVRTQQRSGSHRCCCK